MSQIRVMVVDDSAFMRLTLKGMIEEDSLFTVVTTARNGHDALKKLMMYKPDVITLDIVMGEDMDGLAVLQEIKRIRPTPTIMVSGASDENANYVIDAISNGAFDFICKPSGRPHDIERIEKELQLKLKEAVLSGKKHSRETASDSHDLDRDSRFPSVGSQLTVPKQPLTFGQPEQARPPLTAFRSALPSIGGGLIFIGTSTGGPKALQSVVPRLAKDLPVPVLIVQHMPPRFTQSLAQRLNQMSALAVSEAREGETLERGHAYIAPGGRHLQVISDEQHLKVHLIDTPSVHGVRPAIDVTMESLLKLSSCPCTVAILTGMGRDGADGLKALKEHNHAQVFAIAEAEQSCVVFGMPKAAIETGKVDQIVALQDVASAINDRFVK
ncbi:MAG: chemotaxis-specific protein-glutamate methyltransferase CheB [Sporolactobacillus sp.]